MPESVFCSNPSRKLPDLPHIPITQSVVNVDQTSLIPAMLPDVDLYATTAVVALLFSLGLNYWFSQRSHNAKSEKDPAVPNSAYKEVEVPKDFRAKYEGSGTANETICEEEQRKDHIPSSSHISHLVRTRRSIFPKDFDEKRKVPLHVISDILAAANWAPTHGKTEPWRFCVVGPHTMKKLLDLRLEISLDGLDDPEKENKMKMKIAKKRKELAKISAVIFICVKRVTNSRGKLMPQWEETASTAMAVENLHLQLTSYWNEGYGGYWSSSGYNDWLCDSRVKKILGADGSCEGEDDIVLGAFYLGVCNVKKMNAYRSGRKSMSEKVKWVY